MGVQRKIWILYLSFVDKSFNFALFDVREAIKSAIFSEPRCFGPLPILKSTDSQAGLSSQCSQWQSSTGTSKERKTGTDKYSNHERVRVNNNNNNNKKAQIAVLISQQIQEHLQVFCQSSWWSREVCCLFSLIRNCIDQLRLRPPWNMGERDQWSNKKGIYSGIRRQYSGSG